VQAHIFVSWLTPFKEQRLVVVWGPDKMAVFDDALRKQALHYPRSCRMAKIVGPTAVKADAVPVVIDDREPLERNANTS
jgi:UDP-2-acetamido-3-amino-2,3-dideoxy-glucuronate N-acetyltransferase